MKTDPTKQKKHDLIDIGSKVREMRQRSGQTQAGLAEQLGLSVAYISLIERGGRNPPVTTICAIARALDQRPALVLTGVA